MPTPALDALRAALQAVMGGGASEAERQLLGEALRAGRLVLAEGERSVALGGSADGAIIVTGDGNVVLLLDAAAARELRALLGPPVPRQLPSDLADFTGREREIAAVEQALSGDGGGAISTAIGGMGGIGKTSLAVHVARRLIDRYPDGQIVVDLKGTTEPLSSAAAMNRVIVALDAARKVPDDAADLAGLYRSLLSGKRLLILFDNAADAAQVRELLPAPPSAAIVTSRRKVVLPGLQRVPLDVLPPAEADALLRGIIGEGRASAAERTLLADRCGYLPLALRVAGTFLVSYADWGVAEYLAALADERERLRRLRIEGDVLLDVAAALALSLRQLAHDRPELVEQWRMLAVFAGGFDREAAAAVWAVAPAEARDGLSPLRERSMLLFDAATARYRLHDLMRDLALGAAEPLSGEEERRLEEARDRHSAHYQGLLATANTRFLEGGEGIAAGLAWYDRERANIEAGWSWLAGRAADDEAVARRRSAYVSAGHEVLPLRQHPRERIEWLKTALAAARRLGDRAAAGHLGNLGLAYFSLGEYRQAIEYFEQRLAIAREIGDRQGEGNNLGNLGIAYFRLGEYRRAIEYQEQSLAIARQIGDRKGEGGSLGNLGLAYKNLGEYRQAIEYQEQHLAIAREIGDRQGEGNALGNLGIAYGILREYRRSIELFEQSLALARQIGDRLGEGNAVGNLASAYLGLGEDRRAIEYYKQRLAIAREIGDRRGEGNALSGLGNAYSSLGEYRRAIEYQEQSLALAREIGDRKGEGGSLGNLGLAYKNLGEYRQAIEYQEQHLAIAREIGDRQGEGNALGNLGIAYGILREYRRSIELFEQSLALARQIGDRLGEGNAVGNLASAYLGLGEDRRAIEYYKQRLAIAREIGDRRGEGNALSGLGNAYSSLGEYRRAIEYQEQSLALAREIGDRGAEGNTLGNLGLAHYRLGERAEAVARMQEAVETLAEIKSPHVEQARAQLTAWQADRG